MTPAEVSKETQDPTRASLRIVIGASFTAEPLEDALAFWMDLLGLPASIEFTPYAQVYQQLLDPASSFSRNAGGLNVVLLRPEDWLREQSESVLSAEHAVEELLARHVTEFVQAARATTARCDAPLVVVLCPPSPADLAGHNRARLVHEAYTRIAEGLRDAPGLSLITPGDFELYPVAQYYDARRDRLGHVPYTSELFAALATVLARRIHAQLAPPHKVVVLDCDNTLWQGVVGEDGVDGIKIPPGFAALQRFMVSLGERGILLCLCSKNVEADVMQALERPDMILRKEHLVSWRINWQSKWENIRSLARELNLGLDSFVFLDDNPLECAELGLACPDVLTLRLPAERDIERFLQHVWAFDRPRVTSEDRQRTAMYRQEAERARLQREAPSIGEFLAGLELEITIAEPTAEQLGRVAQLTQRTNQFNFTTARRSEGEIRRLADGGLECRAIEVRDRFGDYGLVGVLIFGARGEALVVDTFLLSCRVLGRGVEHRMLRELGEIARARGLKSVAAMLLFSKKNQPARDFLERVAQGYRIDVENGRRYEMPADIAASIVHRPELEGGPGAGDTDASPAEHAMRPAAPSSASAAAKSARYDRISHALATPMQVLIAVRARSVRNRRPRESAAPVAPRSQLETELVEIWSDVLEIAPIGIRDDFFDLGGTSLSSVDLCAQIEERIGRSVPLTAVMEAPTIEALAIRIAAAGAGESLVLIRRGEGRTPVFLVHDGDGETVLYRNLALRLDAGHPVYGLQPYTLEGVPMAHARISDMAAYHIGKIRTVQPEGPYVVGGMCAGGVIAYEIARQLRALGEQVAVVALLDAADPAAVLKGWKVTQDRLRRSMGVFREARSASRLVRPFIILGKLAGRARNLALYVLKDRSSRMWDAFRLRVFRAYVQRNRPPPTWIGPVSVRAAYLFAEQDYHPASPFDGELLLFRATRGSGADEPYTERYEDPLLGWGARATRGVRAMDVPGGHSSMLQEPHVAVLAQLLQAAIDTALDERAVSVAACIA